MGIEYCYGTHRLDWIELCQVFEKAPLGIRQPQQLQRAVEASYLVCSAHDNNRLVGFARALSDGYYQSIIYDVVVLPQYQGLGVGKALVKALMKRLPVVTGPVLIYAVPGKEGFYKKLGFELLKTGMGRFPDPEVKREQGYI